MAQDNISKKDMTDLTDHSINWSWKDAHVSDSYTGGTGIAGGLKDIAITNFIDSSTTLLLAGPASLEKAVSGVGIRLVPIGVAMGFNLSMQRQVSKIYEIGSRLGYSITGRVSGAIQISRALINGANLLKLMYSGEVNSDYSSGGGANGVTKHTSFVSDPTKEITSTPIGSGPIALNLDSAFFNHPFGLGVVFRDQNDNHVSQHYFEGCLFSSYSVSVSAEQNVLTENVSIEYVRCVPVLTKVDATVDSAELNDSDLIDSPIVGKK